MQFHLTDTKMLSSTTKAFVEKDPRIQDILGNEHPFWNAKHAVDGKRTFSASNRQTLVQQLKRQYESIAQKDSVDPLIIANIERLDRSNTFTITTGQQVHLFIGPAFVIYKTLAVIDQCENFKKQFPEDNFVPIYWLASEDHDFDEIKGTTLFKKNYEWETTSGGACGRLSTDSVKTLIAQIKSGANLDERQLSLLDEFENIYETSSSLSEATIRVMNKFFGTLGLLCIDADNKAFKAEFKNAMTLDILEKKNKLAFDQVSENLENKGLNTQLHGREINFFYLGDQKRNRIQLENGKYKLVDTDIELSEQEIAELIESHPENFSPNASLRPLYQETILPNVAYIGGNAEINYWIQICNIFNINNITPPTLILRPSVWITPSKITQWIAKRGIRPIDLLITENPLELLKFLESDPIDLEGLIQRFEEIKNEAQSVVAQNISKELKPFVEAGKAYEKALKTVEKALKAHRMEKNAQEMDKLEEIRDIYFNIKNIQERKTSSLEMLIKYENVVYRLKSILKLDNSDGHVIPL